MCFIPYRTQTTHFPNPIFHNNLPYPPPYFGYPDWESVTLCKYQHYPILNTYLSFHTDTYPSTYPTLPTVGKIPLPTLSIYFTYPIHVTSAYIPVPTLPFITYHNLHFPTLYYCQGLIKYKAETTYQIRPKRPRTEKTQAETTQAETTQGRNDSGLKRTTRECSCECRTGTYI